MVKVKKTKVISFKASQKFHIMETLEVESKAQDAEFYQRVPRKVTMSSLMMGFWSMMSKGKNTLRNWAVYTGIEIGDSLSKQAIDKRLNPAMLNTVKSVFKHALETSTQTKPLENKMRSNRKEVKGLLKHFNRVILHDSTIQKLPPNLYEAFGGNKTQSGPRALMRIQAMYNLSDAKWLDFSVDTYRKNDQSRADFSIDKLEVGDLLIRDLGYFVLEVLEQLIERQFVITRLQPNVHLFTQEGKQINLLALLRKEKNLDINVLVGAKKQLPMRLVAQKLSKKQRDKRIKDAKKKAHNTSNYSKEYFELLGYEIFLTNIENSIIDGQQIAKLYGLRWYIEIIFKAWKSYFKFKIIFEKNKMNYERTMISIHLILIQFIYVSTYLFSYIKKSIEAKNKYLSILKFMDVLNDLLVPILKISNINQLDIFLPQFVNHAVYEKRFSHKNMMIKYQHFNELQT